jgi:hypothetical protein
MADGTVRAHVLMPRETVEAIDRVVGPRGRSRFLVDAAEEKLRRIRLLEAADRVAGSISEDDAPWWRTPDDISAWVRALRRDADDRSQDTSRDP